jgi:hypothetical protein
VPGLQEGLPTLTIVGQDSDDSHHRCAEVAVGILNAAVWPRRDRLFLFVEVRVEAAVIVKGAGPIETQGEHTGFSSVVFGAAKQGELRFCHIFA